MPPVAVLAASVPRVLPRPVPGAAQVLALLVVSAPPPEVLAPRPLALVGSAQPEPLEQA